MNTLEQVQDFLDQCIAELGLNFHPDNSFEEYCKGDMPIYDQQKAELLNEKMSNAFAFCLAYGHDIYELCMELPRWNTLMNEFEENRIRSLADQCDLD